MKNKITSVFISLVMFAAVFFGTGAAKASHVGPFIKNDTHVSRFVMYDNHTRYMSEAVHYGEFSERDAHFFAVGNNHRVLYKSLATGALYWTPCGEDLPRWSGTPSTLGWHHTSYVNSAQLIKDVVYPTAPANICN